MADTVHEGHEPNHAERHRHDHTGAKHEDHHAHMMEDFKRRLWISLAATVPVLILSPMIQSLVNLSFGFPGDRYIHFAILSFIYFYGGWPFLKGLVDEIGDARPGMMTLIALAISVAYVYSSLVVFGLPGRVFFWELATLIDVMLLGHWIEMKSVMGASKALKELARLMPKEAHLIAADGTTTDVPLDELSKGAKVLVRPGEKIPADGTIVDGESDIDESAITGESKPVGRRQGETVIGGSVNGTGSLTVEVAKTGEDSYLAQVVSLVEKAGRSKSRAQGLADKAAFWLTVIAVTVGLITLTAWLLLGKEFVFALERMVTVMIITCPHALGLAVPLVVATITSLSARNGLLIRNRTAFEAAQRPDVVVFDKTGTLTKGQFGVSDVVSVGDWSEDELLATAAAIEQNSEHTIARGIVNRAREKDLRIAEARDFASIPGQGTKATVDGMEIIVGNRRILETVGVESHEAHPKEEAMAAQGRTTVLVIADNRVQGLIGLADLIGLARIAGRKMKQNLAWATGYNVVAIPLAAGVLYRYGIVLPPAVGAIVMSLSTIIVAINARLIHFDKHTQL